jgi:Ion channel
VLRQLLFGAAVSLLNITVHALSMNVVIRTARSVVTTIRSRDSVRLIAVMIATVSVLMCAHFLEVMIWSQAYRLVNVTPAGADPAYFAFVNYATLGYGDVVPTPEWRLIGPITAMNGVLLFGWSTAVIFEVLRLTLARIQSNA